MDTLRQLPTHGDGLLDMRELARTLLENMVNEIMDAQADMACEDGATARNGYRERGLTAPRRRHRAAHPQAVRGDVLPGGPDREVLARGPRRRGGRRGVVGQRRLDEENGVRRPEDGHREALEGPGQRDVQIA